MSEIGELQTYTFITRLWGVAKRPSFLPDSATLCARLSSSMSASFHGVEQEIKDDLTVVRVVINLPAEFFDQVSFGVEIGWACEGCFIPVIGSAQDAALEKANPERKAA